MNLHSGYNQKRVDPSEIHKTIFCTHFGHYEFSVMSFALTYAPSTFQCAMNDLFRQHLCKFILEFFDDIMVYSKIVKENINHFEISLQILIDNSFYAKNSKYSFHKTQISFFGSCEALIGIMFKLSWSG